MQIRIFLIAIVALGTLCAASRAQDPHAVDPAAFFQTSDRCIACHSQLATPSGEDVSIGYSWRASMMANSARDPYWHAAVRREVMDHPSAQTEIEDKCSTCHMPMARFTAAQAGLPGAVFANIGAGAEPVGGFAADGVSCTVCHQIGAAGLGEDSSFDGGFSIDGRAGPGERPVFGPHAVDAGRAHLMQSAGGFAPEPSGHLGESEFCATCHTLFTASLDASGRQIGTLPEQVPYLEWLASDYRTTRSCQDCHMPVVEGEMPISSVLGQPRPRFSRHSFAGANAFVLGILNRHRAELGVAALPQELEAARRRALDFLGNETAGVAIEGLRRAGSTLTMTVAVSSRVGHKLPTAYPSRRVWLHVVARNESGRVLFESGRPNDDGSIEGNDNDADAGLYEPHYRTIARADQVQIYEPILVDANAAVTTGLLSAVRYAKDNRLLPLGFEKTTAGPDVAVVGAAFGDDDFIAGGDRVGYEIDVADAVAVTVEAELLYQSIGYRWAKNLDAYASAAEPRRFSAYYEEAASGSALRLARDTAEVGR